MADIAEKICRLLFAILWRARGGTLELCELISRVKTREKEEGNLELDPSIGKTLGVYSIWI